MSWLLMGLYHEIGRNKSPANEERCYRISVLATLGPISKETVA